MARPELFPHSPTSSAFTKDSGPAAPVAKLSTYRVSHPALHSLCVCVHG